MAKLKFPNPKDCKRDNPAIICPAERVLGLYNDVPGHDKKRISKDVRKWFAEESLKRGWSGVHFMKEVQTQFGAGCVLWLPPQVTINVTKQMLVLVPQTE
jgi:hypothetical protein